MPVLWGSIVAFILQFVSPEINETVAQALNSEPVNAAVTALIIFAWYALWRKLEPRLPDWATKLVLGSEKAPTYE